MAVTALEYSWLSPAADASVVDQQATATGTAGAAATVESGPTAPTKTANELAVGLYADSGFGDTLAAGAGFTQRSVIPPNGQMQLLTEDQTAPAAATPDNDSRPDRSSWSDVRTCP